MSRACSVPRLTVVLLLLMSMLCWFTVPVSVSASPDELLHTFKVAREARFKNQEQPQPRDIHINNNNNNNNNDEQPKPTHDNHNDNDNTNQHAQIVFPAEATNAMWEFQTTPLPTIRQAETQLSSSVGSLLAQTPEGVDGGRTPFQDLIQQLAAQA